MMQRSSLRALTRSFNSFARTPANNAPLTPVGWLERSATVFGDAEAVRHGSLTRTWLETRDRAVALADALKREYGVGRNDCVQVMLHNTPEMLEAHYGVPMAGAVLGSINTRLDAGTVAYILRHSEAKVLIADADRAPVIDEALGLLRAEGTPVPHVLQAVDPQAPPAAAGSEHGQGESTVLSAPEYETLLQSGRSTFAWQPPADEFDALSLNYTSGSTGRPKGCVLHHRGAYLCALGNMAAFGGMASESATRYLWTLPMFHCNGWNFPYTVAALGGLNVCMRSVDEAAITAAFAEHGVTHLCGAPIVLRMAIEAAKKAAPMRPAGAPAIKMFVAASPPPAATLRDAAAANLDVTHVYGLTEVYGPAALCEWRDAWTKEGVETQAVLKARQGVPYLTQEAIAVLDDDGNRVPSDGETLGEVCFRGNIVMKGYFKDAEATNRAFHGGWFRTGDLGVCCPDGYVALKDRAKDIVISGGENISSIELEGVLYDHPDVLDAAVVAKPDDKWGEVPCAFVEVREGATVTGEDLASWSRERLAGFKVPRSFVFGQLPKTSTGKVQKYILRDTFRSYSTRVRPPAAAAIGRAIPRRSFSTAAAETISTGRAEEEARVLVSIHKAFTGVTTISLLNGRRRNPLCSSTMAQLEQALYGAAACRETRAVLLRGEGPAFSAGHDLRELQAAAALPDEAARKAALQAIFEQCGALMRAIRSVPVPVLAAVHGPAHAAGCQLIAACDLVVADRAHATFATPGVRLGLFCHTPATSVVQALGGGAGGARRAAKMLYTGQAISADEAERIGLVHEVVPEGEAGRRAEVLAAEIASYDTEVMRGGKSVLRETAAASDDFNAAWSIAAAAMVRGLPSPAAKEGIDAFLTKRPPTWDN